jgi:SAM-dependent methyltransferase
MLERATSIPGWMSVAELTWLSEQAKRHRRIVEVGSFMGRSTVALAETLGIVYAVDTFQGSEEHRGFLSCAPPYFLLEKFRANLRPEIESGKVRMIVAKSVDAGRSMLETPDMVFIDGAHDFKSLMHDILTWRRILVPDGLLCGHDYENGTSPDIGQAVRLAVPGFQVMQGGSIWYWPPTSVNASIEEPETVHA